jgi:large subunit ribosomal protein L29
MDAEKIRNLTDAELAHQQRELNDQLFRLKFQLKMGQTESLNKIRGLRKDVARIKTILREKELGLANGAKQTSAAAPSAETATEKKAAPAKKATSAKKKTASAKKSAGAKAKARK